MGYVYGQLKRAAVETLSSDPSTSADKFTGRLWYNTATDLIKYADDAAAVKHIFPDTSTSFNITDGMSATNVTGMTVDAAVYTSMIFECEIKRTTNVFVHQRIHLLYVNSVWQLVEGAMIGALPVDMDDHGLTWSVSEAGGIAQVLVASNSIGTGTLKYTRKVGFDV